MDVSTVLAAVALVVSIFVAIDGRMRQKRASRAAAAVEVRQLSRSMVDSLGEFWGHRHDEDNAVYLESFSDDFNEFHDLREEIADRALRDLMSRYIAACTLLTQAKGNTEIAERAWSEMVAILPRIIKRCGQIRHQASK
jgi:hypothetical protein